MLFVCLALLSVHCSLVVTCFERAYLLALLWSDFLLCICHIPMWYPGSDVVLYLSIFDHCHLAYFSNEWSVPLLSLVFEDCPAYVGVGILGPIKGKLNSRNYTKVLVKHIWPVIAKLRPGTAYVIQVDDASDQCIPPRRPHNGNRKIRLFA